MLKLLVGMPLMILYYYAVKKIRDWRVPPIIFALAAAITLPAFAAIENKDGRVADMLASVSGLSIAGLFIDFYLLVKIRQEWIKYKESPYVRMRGDNLQTFSEFYIDDINNSHPTY